MVSFHLVPEMFDRVFGKAAGPWAFRAFFVIVLAVLAVVGWRIVFPPKTVEDGTAAHPVHTAAECPPGTTNFLNFSGDGAGGDGMNVPPGFTVPPHTCLILTMKNVRGSVYHERDH